MNKSELIENTKNIADDFKLVYGDVTLTTLLEDDYGKYILLFSSKCLDDLSPFDGTLEVVKFFRRHNTEILKDISSIIVIHTEQDKNDLYNQFKDKEYIELY